MTITADASFLVSLYGGDVNSPIARAWMVSTAQPVLLTDVLRFETENALRLACFRGKITVAELTSALSDIESDLQSGIILPANVPADSLWGECRRISAAHTLSMGARAYDITHVAAALLLRADAYLSFDHRQRTLAGQVGLSVAP